MGEILLIPALLVLLVNLLVITKILRKQIYWLLEKMILSVQRLL